MRIFFNCTYCDLKWEENVYSQGSIQEKKCLRCGDSKLKYKDAKDIIIDTYAGCPPFPEKTEAEKKKELEQDEKNKTYWWD
jgi:hypothetical protein